MKKLPLLVFLLSVCPAFVFAQANVEPPLITVTGQAEVRVPSDEVVFTLSIENVDRDMLVANKRTDDSVKQILSIARKNNVKPEDVQTSQISVQPKYNTHDMEHHHRTKVKRSLVGYQVPQ